MHASQLTDLEIEVYVLLSQLNFQPLSHCFSVTLILVLKARLSLITESHFSQGLTSIYTGRGCLVLNS